MKLRQEHSLVKRKLVQEHMVATSEMNHAHALKKMKVKAGLIESKDVHGQLVQMYRENVQDTTHIVNPPSY